MPFPRTRWLVAGTGAAAVLGLVGAPVPARASCAAPVLTVRPALVLVPGQPVVVTGRGFLARCDDTGPPSSGCSGPSRTPAARDVHLVLTSVGTTWELGSADADPDDYTATWRPVVPVDVPPGPAQLAAGGSQAVEVVVAG